MNLKSRTLLLALALLAVWLPRAAAQVSDFPNKAMTLVVPLAPGGSNDVLARIVGQKLEGKFGRSVIIENRPGGGGGIPAALGMVGGPADGYTLIAASSTLLRALLEAQDFKLVAHVPEDPECGGHTIWLAQRRMG